MSDNEIQCPMSLHGLELQGTEEVMSGSFDIVARPWELLCLNERSDLKVSQGRIIVFGDTICKFLPW